MDLYTESHLLSRLNHPNIINVRGVLDSSLADAYKGSREGYFILLDLLETTLFEKLTRWRDQRSRLCRTKTAIVQRLQTAILPVVKAMEYLHSHSIVLRDLKPENIGFDRFGQVKLFDFGMARHISALQESEIAGSICYMAPEVMLDEQTCLSSDVYSFSIILWEVCMLQAPLSSFSDMEEVRKCVAVNNWRPSISTRSIPSKTLRMLLRDCWQREPGARPSFLEIQKRLNKSCHKKPKLNSNMKAFEGVMGGNGGVVDCSGKTEETKDDDDDLSV